MTERTHINETGKVHMVDTGGKEITQRMAMASAEVAFNEKAFKAIADNTAPKGNVFAVAKVAGI